ncbi:MAG: AbrB/MazE/SpoVT family DNA-binding domain-containing protein [Candidatus Omnitrophica bacterium]|nr:AbrB/MazE/SpoVT family DNA-binding domain-containing protein [Candidatus Omnitrophota bacterium]MBU1367729.1 AbrB/MazE/SpoVT family DNA-binding domain-containing protein [Candidatus Omnitrophota bacterium]MBU1523946.1 AbrB/MazE/SpoVT family DNA-binding domain-containing protein [Candidatus Omnitrophota bacterium]MBU1811104.1 AbrB/MazE/SpoVT family DNA-binding domain-containing protein [Candidatus Omnitrophota bacterium]MBU2437399.1 AbrB/MazE/SpoVT family DNA-binding domain-containing protein
MLEVVSKIARNGHLTIPAKIRKFLHIAEGDMVRIGVRDNKIVVMPGTFVDKDQTYFFTKECQREAKKSEQEFKKGKFSSYASAEQLRKEIEGD